MNSKILLASLKAQEANLESLISILENQKKAIVHNDSKALEKEIIEEQNVLKKLDQEEKNRLKIVNDIAFQNSIEVAGNSLDFLLKNKSIFFGKDIKELEKARLSLKNKVKAVMNLNAQLKSIIEFSRNFLREIIITLSGPNKHALVNKRV